MLMETWQYLGSTLKALRQSVPANLYLVESCETLLSTVMSAKPGEVIVGHDIMATDQTDHLLFFSNAFYHLRMIVALQNCYQVFGIKVTRIFESLKDNFLLVNFHQNNHFSVIQTVCLANIFEMEHIWASKFSNTIIRSFQTCLTDRRKYSNIRTTILVARKANSHQLSEFEEESLVGCWELWAEL